MSLILALSAVLGIGHQFQQENPSNSVLEPNNGTLSIVVGNSLMPISPLYYPDYRVYGSVVSGIVQCESGGKHDGIWGDNGKAYGISQFWEGTFYWLAGLAKLQNPDWKSREQQLYLLNWAVNNKYDYLWTCAKK